MVDEAAEREKASRSIFAQNAIKAQDIEDDLRDVDEAIGDLRAVEDFVIATLNNVLGVQVMQNAGVIASSWAICHPQLAKPRYQLATRCTSASTQPHPRAITPWGAIITSLSSSASSSWPIR